MILPMQVRPAHGNSNIFKGQFAVSALMLRHLEGLDSARNPHATRIFHLFSGVTGATKAATGSS